MSEDRPTSDPSANPDTPSWAQTNGEANAEAQTWERTPPPPPGAELEPGEQSRTAVREEQRTGEVTGYSERGVSATDAEMGAEPGQPPVRQQQGWTPGAPESRQQGGGFMEKWQAIQAQFVDNPRSAVEQADQFFEELMRKLQEERQQMRGLWDRGDQSSTEDLRVAMQRYRDYFRTRLG